MNFAQTKQKKKTKISYIRSIFHLNYSYLSSERYEDGFAY